jgi:glyoxylate/hydroxypyruvate reductase
VLVNLLPLTPDTENILDRRTLARLQPGGFVINLARGAHLVDEDLLALLDSGHLAGAVLDVFREEPLPAGHPFWQHPKVVVTPHTSARTLRDESIAQIARKIFALERGEPIAGVVDRDKGY